MQPNRLGRVLGIGARVAAEKIRERTAQIGSAPPPAAPKSSAPAGAPTSPVRTAPVRTAPVRTAPAPTAQTPQVAPQAASANRPPVAGYAQGGRRLARGAKNFSSALVRPFAHATGVLSLQITGVFFAMFTLFFVEHSWQIYRAGGLRDRHLPLYAGFALLFGWFTVSSFWRAARKQKKS